MWVGSLRLGYEVSAVSLLLQGLLCFGECVWEGQSNSHRYSENRGLALSLAPNQILGAVAGVESAEQVC